MRHTSSGDSCFLRSGKAQKTHSIIENLFYVTIVDDDAQPLQALQWRVRIKRKTRKSRKSTKNEKK